MSTAVRPLFAWSARNFGHVLDGVPDGVWSGVGASTVPPSRLQAGAPLFEQAASRSAVAASARSRVRII
jgi:hypothetical protein